MHAEEHCAVSLRLDAEEFDVHNLEEIVKADNWTQTR